MNDKLNLVALVALSVLALGSLVGMVVLEMAGQAVPPSLVAIAATCVGSIAAFIQPSRFAHEPTNTTHDNATGS